MVGCGCIGGIGTLWALTSWNSNPEAFIPVFQKPFTQSHPRTTKNNCLTAIVGRICERPRSFSRTSPTTTYQNHLRTWNYRSSLFQRKTHVPVFIARSALHYCTDVLSCGFRSTHTSFKSHCPLTPRDLRDATRKMILALQILGMVHFGAKIFVIITSLKGR